MDDIAEVLDDPARFDELKDAVPGTPESVERRAFYAAVLGMLGSIRFTLRVIVVLLILVLILEALGRYLQVGFLYDLIDTPASR